MSGATATAAGLACKRKNPRWVLPQLLAGDGMDSTDQQHSVGPSAGPLLCLNSATVAPGSVFALSLALPTPAQLCIERCLQSAGQVAAFAAVGSPACSRLAHVSATCARGQHGRHFVAALQTPRLLGSPPAGSAPAARPAAGQIAGYVERERYETKLRHRQLGQLLCHRCQELSNGAMIPAVADFAQREDVTKTSPAGAAPRRGGRGGAAPALAAAVAVQHAEAAGVMREQAAAADSRRARRPTGFTDKVLLTPEELRQKLK